jgi:hypothetical protein
MDPSAAPLALAARLMQRGHFSLFLFASPVPELKFHKNSQLHQLA